MLLVDVRILGPLEAYDSRGRSLDLGGRQQRIVLTMLLLHRNEIVSIDRLIEAIWGEAPPPNAVKNVQVQVSRLRKALEGAAVLTTHASGYSLHLPCGDLDVDRFEQLLEDARRDLAAGEADAAESALREGLTLWRGPPLADFAYEAFAQPEIARLDELRLTAVEDRLDAQLACGRHREVTSELHRLVAAHPLRERLRAQLILALYRSGRKPEALRVYEDARRLLAEELGLEPSESLRRLQTAVLADDPALGAPSVEAPRARPPQRAAVLETSRRRAAIGIGGALLLGASLAIAALASTRDEPSATAVSLGPNSVLRLDSSSGKLAAVVPAGRLPAALAVADGGFWVISERDGTAAKIDPASEEITRTVSVRGSPKAVAAAGRDVWVASSFAGAGVVTLLDARTGDTRAVTTLPRAEIVGLAAGEDAVWVAAQGGGGPDGRVYRLAADTAGVTDTIPLPSKPVGIAMTARAVWITAFLTNSPSASGDEGSVYRVDRRSNTITASGTVQFSPAVGGAVGAGTAGVWVASERGFVSLIDPGSAEVATKVSVGGRVVAVTVLGNAVWTLSENGAVARIDPADRKVVWRTKPLQPAGSVPLELTDVAVLDGAVWLTAASERTTRVGSRTAVAIPVRPTPSRIRFVAGSIWTKSVSDPSVVRIDARTRRVTAVVRVGSGHGDIAFGHGSVWVTSFDENTVTRIDPRTNRVLASIPTNGLAPVGLTVTRDAVWVANHHGDPTGSVVRIDPRTNAVVAEIRLGAKGHCCGPSNMTTAAGDVWVDIPNQHRLVRIDAETGRVAASILMDAGCGQMGAAGTTLWVAEGCSNTVLRIDTRTNRIVKRIDTGNANVVWLTLAPGAVWVTTDDHQLLRIDPTTDTVTERIDLASAVDAGFPYAPFVASARGALWIADGGGSRVVRLPSAAPATS